MMGERRGGGLTIYKRESKDLTMVKFMDLKLKNRKQGTSAYPVALSGAAESANCLSISIIPSPVLIAKLQRV